MGIYEGLLGGFGKALSEAQREAAEQNVRQTELEMRILSTLASADDPEIQQLAVQGMLGAATGQGRKRKGGILAALTGEKGPSPQLQDVLAAVGSRKGPTAAMPETSFVEGEKGREVIPPGASTPAADVYGGETVTEAPQPATTPAPLFLSPYEQQVRARAGERRAMGEEIRGLGGGPQDVLGGVYGISEPPAPGLPDMDTIELADGIYTWDPASGQLGQRLGEAPGGRRSNLQSITTDQGVFAWDPQTGQVVTRLGGTRQGETPRDRPGYLDAVAAIEAIDRQIKAAFPDYGRLPLTETQKPQVQALREQQAQRMGYGSYDELLMESAFRRGEPTISPPPGDTQQGIMGQGKEADDARMGLIVQKFRENPEAVTEQDKEFARQHDALYGQGR